MNLTRNSLSTSLTALTVMFLLLSVPISSEQGRGIEKLLPKLESWTLKEDFRTYQPENLFEYINGAAESYLSYQFKELLVAEYSVKDQSCEVILEIYDMGDPRNSFGIYSSERYPDNNFISVGTQGYLEQGTLNFLVGEYYIKLMSFECGDQSREYLKKFAETISEKVSGKHQFPAVLQAFPKQGLIENSERFILINYLGYDFLHSGYSADYQLEGNEFSCFIIKGDNETDAEQMFEKYFKAKKDQEIEKTSYGYHIKDRYYENIFLTQKGPYICGVMEIKDSFEDIGEKYLAWMVKNLEQISPVFPLI